MNNHLNKVVLFGPPLAGKRTLLETYALLKHKKSEVYQLKPEGTSPIADVALRLRFKCGDTSIEFHTLSGSPWYASSWDDLFHDAWAAILVLDAQATRTEANMSFLTLFQQRRERAHLCCIAVTKQDLVHAGVSCTATEKILKGFDLGEITIFLTRCDEAHTLYAPLDWISQRVLDDLKSASGLRSGQDKIVR